MSSLVTRRDDGSISFYIDDDLQFDSADERVYHECLSLPAMVLSQKRGVTAAKALIIGGGDGLLAREMLRWQSIRSIDLVDYDKAVVELGKTQFAQINEHSLSDSRLKVHVEDGWKFVEDAIAKRITYDIVICDLTVAQDIDGARFHTIDWYENLSQVLGENGVVAVNGVSPSATPRAFWSIFNSMRSSGLQVRPYRINVPSFTFHGYGADWSFFLGSSQQITTADFDGALVGLHHNQILRTDADIKRMFLFPEELLPFQPIALPSTVPSDVLIHYFLNDAPLEDPYQQNWNAIAADTSAFAVPKAHTVTSLLPPEITEALAQHDVAEEQILSQVLELMPAVNRFQTRALVADFLSDPSSFLEALDLEGLVELLLQRAAELPARIVAELQHLQEKLAEWMGDLPSLLELGSRAITVITVVVILGNLAFPDAVYGKGHAGGGAHHAAAAGHAAGRGDGARAADHDMAGGRRGMDRGDHRGWGERGYGHWGHWNAWGGHWGTWGGWARPWHRWYWGGWGGWGGTGAWLGWGVPVYAGVNVASHQVALDEQGYQYPARSYTYNTYVNNYTEGGEAVGAPQPSANDQVAQDKSPYRLGPDTDILPDGRVVMQLTPQSYLLLLNDKTQVIDQTSGASVMSLYSDPSLRWHIASEIRRQGHQIREAMEKKQSALDAPQATGFPTQSDQAQTELTQMKSTVDLLDKALATLGPVADQPGKPVAPPVGALELFTNTWTTPDGSMLIFKRSDGQYVFMDGAHIYKNAEKTPAEGPYPARFKAVVLAYLGGLTSQSASVQASLNKDKTEAQQRLAQLQKDLQEYQPPDNRSATSTSVTFGPDQVTSSEAQRRTNTAIRVAQHRVNVIQKQLDSMPAETAAANALMVKLKTPA